MSSLPISVGTVTTVATALATLYLAYKLKQLNDDRHELTANLDPATFTEQVDESLYPQLYRSPNTGLLLRCYRWVIPNPKGVIFIVHGFREHAGRYESLALEFNKAGYNAVAIDHHGHGGSQGDRTYVQTFEHYYLDYIGFMQREYDFMKRGVGVYGLDCFHINDTRIFKNIHLFAHSMGGLITTLLCQYLDRHRILPFDIASVVLSAPALALDENLVKNKLLITASSVLSAVVPRARVTKIAERELSTNPLISTIARSDPLTAVAPISARFGHHFIKYIDIAHQQAKSFKLPVFIFHSPDDTIVDIRGSRAFFDEIPVDDKEFFQCRGLHEAFVDLDRTIIIQKVLDWFDKHDNSTATQHTTSS